MLGIKAYTDPLTDSMFIHIVERMNGKITHIAQPVVFEMTPLVHGGYRQEPTFSLPQEVLQDLYNQLTKDGYKSTDQSYIEGELTATKEHLKDMRTIVMKQLNPPFIPTDPLK